MQDLIPLLMFSLAGAIEFERSWRESERMRRRRRRNRL